MEKVCENGHRFNKSSSCPVCPICEAKKTSTGFLLLLSAPARRALEREGITTLYRLSTYSKSELLSFHGFGKSSIPILEKALNDVGLAFAE